MNANTALKINDAIDQGVRCGESLADIRAQVERAIGQATREKGARLFSGSEIRRAILDAVEAIPEDEEITEFEAGENMLITYSRPEYATRDRESYEAVVVGFSKFAWTGTRWDFIEGA